MYNFTMGHLLGYLVWKGNVLRNRRRGYIGIGRSTGDLVLSPRAKCSGQATSAPSIMPYVN
jgi:hypothetical protein